MLYCRLDICIGLEIEGKQLGRQERSDGDDAMGSRLTEEQPIQGPLLGATLACIQTVATVGNIVVNDTQEVAYIVGLASGRGGKIVGYQAGFENSKIVARSWSKIVGRSLQTQSRASLVG